MKEYYVYCHKNPETLEIFYIGKGIKKRAYKKDGRGKYWINYVNKYGLPIIEFLYENLNEDDAIKIEKELILKIGRKDLNKGPLVNTTDGGEGCSGLVHSEKSKKLISESRKGKTGNNKGKTWKFKIPRTKGLKRGNYKLRKDKGKKFSQETIEKFKEGKRNKAKKVLQFSLNMEFIQEWRSAADIMEKLKLKGLYNNLNGRSNSCGGFVWIYK